MPGAQDGGKIGTPVQLGFDSAVPSAPAPGAPCPHCHRHGHPTQVGSGGPLPGHMPRAGPPHGPTFSLDDISQGVQDLTLLLLNLPGGQIQAEWQSALDAMQAIYGPLWNRDVSGRLQRVPRGQTGGSDGSGNLQFGMAHRNRHYLKCRNSSRIPSDYINLSSLPIRWTMSFNWL